MNAFATEDQKKIQADKKKERDRIRMARVRMEQEKKIEELEMTETASAICIATLSSVIRHEVVNAHENRRKFLLERSKKRFAYFYLFVATAALAATWYLILR